MPKSTATPARNGRPPLSGSAEIEAMVARTAPAILQLLADGVPHAKNAIITALADRHPKEDVVRTLMRLAVTGQLVESERKYSLASAPETEAEGPRRVGSGQRMHRRTSP
jgi:Asp/Glu/hydantoin racemase